VKLRKFVSVALLSLLLAGLIGNILLGVDMSIRVYSSSMSMPDLATIVNESMVEVPQPIAGEVVTGVIETDIFTLIRTNGGIRKSTDNWQTWSHVFNATIDNRTWPVFKQMSNGWIFASASSQRLVSKDKTIVLDIVTVSIAFLFFAILIPIILDLGWYG